MREEIWWKIIVALGLVTLSLALYTVHFFLFQDPEHILIFLVSDIAFLPIEVLVVTLIIDQMLESRERQQRMEKLNLVIGTFFSTEGTPLLAMLAGADPRRGDLRRELVVQESWTPARFTALHKELAEHPPAVDIAMLDTARFAEYLFSREEFVLRVVENPMVFEHESFTDLLLALGHVTEEFKARQGLASLPPADRAHLERDINRVYAALIVQWLRYMEYIHARYPYLFSLAMRTNPFDEAASVVIS